MTVHKSLIGNQSWISVPLLAEPRINQCTVELWSREETAENSTLYLSVCACARRVCRALLRYIAQRTFQTPDTLPVCGRKAIPDKAALPDFPLFPFFLALIVRMFRIFFSVFFRLRFCCVISCVCSMPGVDPHVPHILWLEHDPYNPYPPN